MVTGASGHRAVDSQPPHPTGLEPATRLVLLLLAGFAVTALTGAPVELRTALALPFRAAFWLVIAWALGHQTHAAR